MFMTGCAFPESRRFVIVAAELISGDLRMNNHIAIEISPTREILALCRTQVPDYVALKRRKHELGGVIAKLNHELMFGTAQKREGASAALEKLGFVLD